jgi:hypothetical protein
MDGVDDFTGVDALKVNERPPIDPTPTHAQPIAEAWDPWPPWRSSGHAPRGRERLVSAGRRLCGRHATGTPPDESLLIPEEGWCTLPARRGTLVVTGEISAAECKQVSRRLCRFRPYERSPVRFGRFIVAARLPRRVA